MFKQLSMIIGSILVLVAMTTTGCKEKVEETAITTSTNNGTAKSATSAPMPAKQAAQAQNGVDELPSGTTNPNNGFATNPNSVPKP